MKTCRSLAALVFFSLLVVTNAVAMTESDEMSFENAESFAVDSHHPVPVPAHPGSGGPGFHLPAPSHPGGGSPGYHVPTPGGSPGYHVPTPSHPSPSRPIPSNPTPPSHPGSGNPGYGHPGYGNPGAGHPGFGNPGYGHPGYGNPGSGSPGYGHPGYGNPGSGHPGYGHPGYGHPGYSRPVYSRPVYPVRRGYQPWPHWSHPYFSRPVFYFEWDRLRSVTCTSEDSYGNQYPVTLTEYTGYECQSHLEELQDYALDRCYSETNGDESCFLAGCFANY